MTDSTCFCRSPLVSDEVSLHLNDMHRLALHVPYPDAQGLHYFDLVWAEILLRIL